MPTKAQCPTASPPPSYLVLDVHLSTPLVLGALPGQGIVHAELVRVRCSNGLQLLVVQGGLLVSHTHEHPEQAGELVARHGLQEAAAPERAEGGNSGSGGNADQDGVGVGGHQQDLARWTCWPYAAGLAVSDRW